MNLYLKYRPRTIEELDLLRVREGFLKIVASNKLNHAYLFTGPRGAGKTSAARILARIANCEKNKGKLGEPCNNCPACKSILEGSAMDVIEIDAASNRGIDDVRELKEKIGLSPSSLAKKVYIIDEVHMMTTEAFNALLKTLEEPPKHALFILCTTEGHKIPETISSRCSRVLFTKANSEEMLRSLQRVVKGEKAKVSKEALALLAGAVDGSFRDGVKILDQVFYGANEVGVKEMEQVLSGTTGYSVRELASALINKDLKEALAKMGEGTEQGVELMYLIVSLINKLREEVVNGRVELAILINELDEVARKLMTSPVPEILLEMVIVGWCTGFENPKSNIPGPKQLPSSGEEKDTRKVKSETKKRIEYHGSSKDLWQELLTKMNGDSYSLEALLAKAKPGLIQGDELTIEVGHEFHRDQIMTEKYRAKIETLIGKVVGQNMRINCVVVEGINLQMRDKVDTMSESSPEEDTLITEAVEIFS